MQIEVQPIPAASSSKDIDIAGSHSYPFVIVKAQIIVMFAH
jgi:hypothetical protein